MKRLLIALICATLPAIAQIPLPQINLTGNIGCVGFPCLNSGTLIMSADADRTMTALETSAFYLKVTSSVPLTATRNLIAPLGNFPFTIENATTGGQAIQIIGTTGTGVTIPNGQTVAVWNDGTNFVQIGSAGGGIPGGSNTDVQYNNSGAFGGYPLTNFILSTGNQTITYNNNGASTLTIANPNAGSSATSGYLASNGTDFFALELAGTGTSLPGAVGFVSSNATAPLSFTTGGGPILFNAANTNISGALNYAADTGSANAYVVAPPSCVSATHAGTTINFKAANASTGASTLVYCTGSPVTLYKNGSTALTTGDILAGAQYSARFDGTNWQLLNSSLGGSSLPTATAAGQAPISTGAGTTYVAGQVAPIPGSYTFYLSGSTYYARNNNTLAIDYYGTDAGVVINAAINNVAGTCGTLHFQNGIYNINSLTEETASGFTQVYYGIRIPNIASSGQYCQWNVTGDSNAPIIDSLGTGVQTGGVIFNITSTAVASVPGATTANIIGIWQQPPAGSGNQPGPSDFLSNFDVRFPTNQRGSETAVDMTQALNVHYRNVVADTAVAQGSLAFPVAGTYGMYGLTTTLSVHEENTMELAYAIGYDHALDIESEHTVLIHSYGLNSNYCIDYGVRGSSIIQHNSVFIDSGWGECAHGLTLGANISNGATLDIVGLDAESATSGIWAPVYHGKEINSGYASGNISYSNGLAGGGYGSWVLFDGGGGTAFNLYTSAVNVFGNLVNAPNVGLYANGTANPYAGMTTNNAPTSATASWTNGVGHIGETTLGVATKWFVYDNTHSLMDIAFDSAGSTALGYATPLPATFPNAFNVGSAGQFGVTNNGEVSMTSTASDVSTPNLGITDNSTGATTGNHPLNMLSPNQPSTGFSEAILGKAIATNNATVLGFWDQSSGNACNSAFLGAYGSPTTLTVAGDGFVGIGVAAGTCPVATLEVDGTIKATGAVTAPSYATATNCSSAASPAVCGSAASGSVVVAASATTVVVDTSAVTANSQIQLTFDSSLGTKLGVTCNTSIEQPTVSARTGGTSFTITVPTTVSSNPDCVSYTIVN